MATRCCPVAPGPLLPDQPIPLLQAQPSAQRWKRTEISQDEALRIWADKRRRGGRSVRRPGEGRKLQQDGSTPRDLDCQDALHSVAIHEILCNTHG